EYPEEAANPLSLHYFEAGEYQPAWRYAVVAAKRAESVYANVDAAGFYSRALEAGRNLPDLGQPELAGVYEALGDAWYRAGEFRKASAVYQAARPLVARNPLPAARLLLKLAHPQGEVGL